MNKKKDKEYSIDDIAKYIIRYPQFTDSQIAEKFDINRTKVWRARQLTLTVKFTKTKKKLGQAITFNGFEGIKEEVTNTETKRKEYRVVHAGGPISGTRSTINSLVFGENQYDENIINHWKPYMQLSVNDEITGKPLSAASITYKRNSKKGWYPRYFSNPMQSLDYQTFEAHLRSTIGGPLLRSFVKFLFGKGVSPELELINPGEDSIENQREIDSHQDIIKSLLQIEYQYSYDENGYLDTAFQDKIESLIANCFAFNRSAIIQRYDQSIIIDDKKFSGLPSSGQQVHARELGIIETDPFTSRLKAVQWQNANGMVDIDETIYLWNPLVSSTTYNVTHYGDSMALPMIDALRVIRTNIGVNFPAMGENAYSGLGLLFVKPQGSTEAQKEAEYLQVSRNIVPATTNILMEDPDNVKYENVNYQPEVDKFVNMTESLIKYCAATLGMPHSMFYDEAASNRATMIGKIDLTIETVMNPLREWLDRALSPQTYDKWFRQVYAKDDKLLKKFRIKMVFEDLHIAEWYDKVEAVNELDARHQLTDKSYGALLGIDNYTGKIETGAETIPGGGSAGGKSFSFGNKENSFKIKDTSKMK